MLSDSQREFVARMTSTMQIIIGALAAGVLVFGGIALFVSVVRDGSGEQNDPFLSYVAAGFALLSLIASWIVPSMIAAKQQQAIAAGEPLPGARVTENLPATAELGDVAPLVGLYQTRQIVRAAILEGAAFLNLIIYIIERQPLCLVAAGVLVLFILSQFPTRSRVNGWIESEMVVIAQLRQMAPIDAR